MNADSRNALAWLGGLFGGIAALAIVASFLWTPEAFATGAPFEGLGWSPPPCPGCAYCGMSRAFSAVSHLRFTEAVSFHPFVVLHYPLFLFIAVAGPALAARRLLRRTT